MKALQSRSSTTRCFAVTMVFAVVVLGTVGAASASIWANPDTYNETLTYNGSPSYQAGAFDIADDGFDPGTGTATDATVSMDDNGSADVQMSAMLGGSTVATHIDAGVALGGGLTANVMAVGISEGGKLTYKNPATKDDFVIPDYTGVDAKAGVGADVPEPATIVIWSLLGAGSWVGTRVWRRRGSEVGPASRQPWSAESRQAIHDIISRKG